MLNCYVCGTSTNQVLEVTKGAETLTIGPLCSAEECRATMNNKLDRWGFDLTKRLVKE